MNNLSVTTMIGILVVLALVGALLFAFAQNAEQERLLSITSFDACVAAGYPVMESYPEQCRTPDGRTFVNERQNEISGGGLNIQANGCAVAGCSGQLCVSAAEATDVITTCEYRPEYACYREAACEPQTDGTCGWTQTPNLLACLKNPPPEGEPQAL